MGARSSDETTRSSRISPVIGHISFLFVKQQIKDIIINESISTKIKLTLRSPSSCLFLKEQIKDIIINESISTKLKYSVRHLHEDENS
jgi:hypothetical protein